MGKGRRIKDIAQELGCSWHTVNLSVRRWGEALLEADTTRIGRVQALGSGRDVGCGDGGGSRPEPGPPASWTHPLAGWVDMVRGRSAAASVEWITEHAA